MAPFKGGWAQNVSFEPNPAWTGIGAGRLDDAFTSGGEAEAPPVREAVGTTRQARIESPFAARRLRITLLERVSCGPAGTRQSRAVGPLRSRHLSVTIRQCSDPAGLIVDSVVSGSIRVTPLRTDG
jgi:hypothetical protein